MTLYKLKSKSLITNEDIAFNQKYGLPVEVFCPRRFQTVAFGKVNTFSSTEIEINGIVFSRETNAFFGHPSLVAS